MTNAFRVLIVCIRNNDKLLQNDAKVGLLLSVSARCGRLWVMTINRNLHVKSCRRISIGNFSDCVISSSETKHT